jgi:hypothetical protein
MQWIIIIAIIIVTICVLQRRRKRRPVKPSLTDGQLASMERRVRNQIGRLAHKDEDTVKKKAEEHVTVPLNVIVKRLERYKRENRGNESAVKEIDTKIAKLNARYDDEIPIEAVYEIAKEVMQ